MKTHHSKQYIDLAQEPPFTLGALLITPAAREVRCGDVREPLEPRVMQVLTALARERGEIVSRASLIRSCWDNRVVGDDAINRCIGRIRRLSQSPGGFVLETIPRVGYRLVADDTPHTSAVPEPSWSLTPEAFRRFVSRWTVPFLAFGVMVAVAVGFWLMPPWGAGRAGAPARTVAVLPFAPLTAGMDKAGDHIAAAIAGMLGKSGLRITPMSEGELYRGSARAEALHKLKDAYVIGGEVLRQNGRIRVYAHIDDTRYGVTVYARSFDGGAEDEDVLADRIAARMAGLIGEPHVLQWDADKATSFFQMQDLLLRGICSAAGVAARSLAKAYPDDALLQVSYGLGAANWMDVDPSALPPDRIAEVLQAADRALARNRDAGGGYALKARIAPTLSWASRAALLREAAVATPDAPDVPVLQVWFTNATGYIRAGDISARNGYERFPALPVSAARLAEYLLTVGKPAEARQILTDARRLWPENRLLQDLAFEAAGLQPVLDPTLVPTGPPEDRAALWQAVLRARQTRRAEDRAALMRACAGASNSGSLSEVLSVCMTASALLGQNDAAFAFASRLYPSAPTGYGQAEGGPVMPAPTRYLFLPANAPMRADPRFADLATRTGLLAYWQASRRPPDFCQREATALCAQMKRP